MKSTNKSVVSLLVSSLAMMLAPQLIQAADNYVVITRSFSTVGDGSGASSPRSFTFSLPSNVSTSSNAARSPVLQYSTVGTEFNDNEIYINPPGVGCFPNSADGNQPRSLGSIEDFDADADMLDDAFVSHTAFNGSFLQTGTNTLVVCARNASGGTTPNLDDFRIGAIVLHYQTN